MAHGKRILLTECLQNDFLLPPDRSASRKSPVHVGRRDSERLLGRDGSKSVLVEAMREFYTKPAFDDLCIIHILDWHDRNDPLQVPELEHFGDHCIVGTRGAELLDGIRELALDPYRTHIIHSTSVNDFADTRLEAILQKLTEGCHLDDVKVGVIGVWTGVKVRYLVYELKTRMNFSNIAVCSQMTADRNVAAHDDALQHLAGVFGVRVLAADEFADWLAEDATVKPEPPASDPAARTPVGGSVPAEGVPGVLAPVCGRLAEIKAEAGSIASRTDAIRNDVLKAVRQAKETPDLCAVGLRRGIEAIVSDLFRSRMRQEPGTRPLDELIRTLCREKHIPRIIATHMDTVRAVGNLGAHPLEGEAVRVNDLEPALRAFVSVFEWFAKTGGPH